MKYLVLLIVALPIHSLASTQPCNQVIYDKIYSSALATIERKELLQEITKAEWQALEALRGLCNDQLPSKKVLEKETFLRCAPNPRACQ